MLIQQLHNQVKTFLISLPVLLLYRKMDFPLRLLTAAVGMSAEAGEFTEIIKKIIFQGKPVNEDNLFHLKRELGDIMWYVAQACLGLDISLDEVLQLNYEKLSARYPEGTFDIERSENRVDDDI